MYFDNPRPSWAENGVRHGSKFFHGTSKGNTITGVLSSYTKNCPIEEYPVKGEVAKDAHSVFVEGLRPIRDDQCRLRKMRKVRVEVYYDHGS
jgi:hypothetical protein